MADILVVDDDALTRGWLEEFLRRHDFRVRAVASGAQALAHLAETPCRVVITDINMPEMDGIELANHVARHAPSTAIIAVSGCPVLREPIGRLLLLRGAKGLLSKPIDGRQLLALLAGLVTPCGAPARLN